MIQAQAQERQAGRLAAVLVGARPCALHRVGGVRGPAGQPRPLTSPSRSRQPPTLSRAVTAWRVAEMSSATRPCFSSASSTSIASCRRPAAACSEAAASSACTLAGSTACCWRPCSSASRRCASAPRSAASFTGAPMAGDRGTVGGWERGGRAAGRRDDRLVFAGAA